MRAPWPEQWAQGQCLSRVTGRAPEQGPAPPSQHGIRTDGGRGTVPSVRVREVPQALVSLGKGLDAARSRELLQG